MEHQTNITLLVKQFGEKLSTEESSLLNDWLNESDEHQHIADDYRLTWERIPVEENLTIQPDLDLAFDRLMNKINAAEPPAITERSVLKPIWLRPLSRAAAAILVLTTGVWGYQNYLAGPATLTASADNLEKKSVTLPDGTNVWLRKGSQLKYPKQFDQATRNVELVGEAYFEVAPNAQKPFCIETEAHENIKVIGTRFNVKPTNAGTLVTVQSGTVLFEPTKGAKGAPLTAGKQGLHKKSSQDVVVSNVSSMNALAWQRGGLEFLDVPLHQVIKDLEDYYQVHITLENPNIQQCRYTAPLVQLPIDKVLENLCAVYNIHLFNPNPGEFILREGNCL